MNCGCARFEQKRRPFKCALSPANYQVALVLGRTEIDELRSVFTCMLTCVVETTVWNLRLKIVGHMREMFETRREHNATCLDNLTVDGRCQKVRVLQYRRRCSSPTVKEGSNSVNPFYVHRQRVNLSLTLEPLNI